MHRKCNEKIIMKGGYGDKLNKRPNKKRIKRNVFYFTHGLFKKM